MSMPRTRITIVLEVNGDPDDARYAVECALDNGRLQEEVNEFDGGDKLDVISAILRTTEDVVMPARPK